MSFDACGLSQCHSWYCTVAVKVLFFCGRNGGLARIYFEAAARKMRGRLFEEVLRLGELQSVHVCDVIVILNLMANQLEFTSTLLPMQQTLEQVASDHKHWP